MTRNSKDEGEFLFWKQLYESFVKECKTEEPKVKSCLDVSWNITFPRYKNDLFIDENSFLNQTILDIGCGPNGGIIGFQNCIKYGVDHLIDEYRKIGFPLDRHNINYTNCKSENIPFENNYFDSIVCVNALDHVDSLDLTIKEIERVLKIDGCFLSQLNFRKNPTLTEPIVLNHDLIRDKFLGCGMKIIESKYQYSIEDEKRYFYKIVKT